jgi:hypothetical protein
LLHTAVWQAAPTHTLHKHWLWRKPRQSLAHCSIVAVVEAVGTTAVEAVGTTVVEGTAAAEDMSVAAAIATVEELQS